MSNMAYKIINSFKCWKKFPLQGPCNVLGMNTILDKEYFTNFICTTAKKSLPRTSFSRVKEGPR